MLNRSYGCLRSANILVREQKVCRTLYNVNRSFASDNNNSNNNNNNNNSGVKRPFNPRYKSGQQQQQSEGQQQHQPRQSSNTQRGRGGFRGGHSRGQVQQQRSTDSNATTSQQTRDAGSSRGRKPFTPSRGGATARGRGAGFGTREAVAKILEPDLVDNEADTEQYPELTRIVEDLDDGPLADSLLEEPTEGESKKKTLAGKVLKKKDTFKKEQLYLNQQQAAKAPQFKSSRKTTGAQRTESSGDAAARDDTATRAPGEDIVDEEDMEGGADEVNLEHEMLDGYASMIREQIDPAADSLNDLQSLSKKLEDSNNPHFVQIMHKAIMTHAARNNIIHSNDMTAVLLGNSTEKLLDSTKEYLEALRNTIMEAKSNGELTPEQEELFSKFAPALVQSTSFVPQVRSTADQTASEEGHDVDEADELEVTEAEGTGSKAIMNNDIIREKFDMISSTATLGISPLFSEKAKELRLMQLKKEGKLTPEIVEAYYQRIPLEDLITRMKNDLVYRLSFLNETDRDIDQIIREVINEHLVRGLAAQNMKDFLKYEKNQAENPTEETGEPKTVPSFTIDSTTVPQAHPELLKEIIPQLQSVIAQHLQADEKFAIQMNHFQHMKSEKTAKITKIYQAIKDKIESKKTAARTIGEMKDDSVDILDIPRMIRELIDQENAEQERLAWKNNTDADSSHFLKYDSFENTEKLEENMSELQNSFAQQGVSYLENNYNDFADENDPDDGFLSRGEDYEEFRKSILDSHVAVRRARFKKRLEEYEDYVVGKTIQMPHIKDVEAVVTAGKRGRQRIIAPIERYMDEYIDSVPPSLARERLINNIRAISTNPTLTVKEKQDVIRGLRDAYLSYGLHEVQLTEENMPVKVYPGKRTHMHPARVNPRDAAVQHLMLHREGLKQAIKQHTKRTAAPQEE